MELAEERREKLARMRLYLITGDRGGETETVRTVAAALEGGVTVVQLRKKTVEMGEQYAIALALRRLAGLHEALRSSNILVAIAIAVGTGGNRDVGVIVDDQ